MKTLSYSKKNKIKPVKGIDLALCQLGIKIPALIKKSV